MVDRRTLRAAGPLRHAASPPAGFQCSRRCRDERLLIRFDSGAGLRHAHTVKRSAGGDEQGLEIVVSKTDIGRPFGHVDLLQVFSVRIVDVYVATVRGVQISSDVDCHAIATRFDVKELLSQSTFLGDGMALDAGRQVVEFGCRSCPPVSAM